MHTISGFKEDSRGTEPAVAAEEADTHHGEKRKRISSSSSKPSKDGSNNQPAPAIEISESAMNKWEPVTKSYKDERKDHMYISSCVKMEVDDDKFRPQQHTQMYEQTEINANIKKRAGVQAAERLKKVLPKLKNALSEAGKKSLLASIRLYTAGTVAPGWHVCLCVCMYVRVFSERPGS
jgi:hypothetical protein